MKKEIRHLTASGLVQVTTTDSRWYAKPTMDRATGLPNGFEYVPSVTWIAGYYPKGTGFYKWLAGTGWDESQAIKAAAGDKGSKVHTAIATLIDGQTVEMDALVFNPSTGQPEPLTLEEYECLMSFVAWAREAKPVTIAKDLTVWNEEDGYAGTVDYLCLIDKRPTLIDFKTSQQVWPEHEIQVSAYAHALAGAQPSLDPALLEALAFSPPQLAILQLGYRRNKVGWKFTVVEDQYPLFLAAKQIWAKETAGEKPLQKDYPVRLAIAESPETPEPVVPTPRRAAPKRVIPAIEAVSA